MTEPMFNLSQVVAVLLKRIGEPQLITRADMNQFDAVLPTIFTVDQEADTIHVEIDPDL